MLPSCDHHTGAVVFHGSLQDAHSLRGFEGEGVANYELSDLLLESRAPRQCP